VAIAADSLAAGATPPAPEPIVPTGAVVLGSDYRALGIVRSLGRRGIPVHVIASGDDRLAAHSRYATSTSELPDDDADQLCALELLASAQGRTWALFPSADESAAFVARNHAALARLFRLTTPPWETLKWAYDKRYTNELGARTGVATPFTIIPRDRKELAEAPLEFPVILKPAIKPEFNQLTAAKAWRVDDRESLLKRYDEACTLVDPATLMVQQVIPGNGQTNLSYAALAVSGRELHSIVARRTRQYPADFGRASTFVETIEDPGIVEPSRRLLEASRFTGLIEIEFKLDQRTNRPLLLDMNPRVWGWHTLGRRAGVDFPWLQWLQLVGEDPPAVTAKTGVRWIRMTTDLPSALKEILARRMSAWTYLASLRPPHEGAIFARDDLLPGLVELPLLIRTLARRLAGGEGV
jgi:D-aspartate ligase